MKQRTLIAGIALLAMSATTAAETLHKCIGKHGAVSYTGAPCKADEKEARSIDYQPEAASRLTAAPERSRERHPDRETVARSHRSERYAESASDQKRRCCDTAKAQRDAAFRRLGIHRTFAQSRSWDETVEQACR